MRSRLKKDFPILIAKYLVIATQPAIRYPQAQPNSTYMLLLVDLSIPQPSINGTGPRAPGLELCRSTRLHWFQGDVMQSRDNGTLIGNGAAIAPYAGPKPGLNDIRHTYTFYLFPQPVGFVLPIWDAGRDYSSIAASARMNFSVQAVADEVGPPIAASYMRVQNPMNNATGTASNGSCAASSTAGSENGTGIGGGASASSVPYAGGAVVMGANAVLVTAVGLVFAFL
ncbi:hypothetical protein LTR62_005183 [Meristemomyces frigidus]|uniref:PEBP-like protein n=1 Tax=Meristemomyces frigidus TaxID=1508187 RepID=A0AAN7TFP2_9PEZI|nr:hypothetical protein LTR62_005183 [Meristemomyces frigidus]